MNVRSIPLILLLVSAHAVAAWADDSPAPRHPAGRMGGTSGSSRVVEVALPSAATGMAGGTLALRLDVPWPGGTLLGEGAPVAVVLPGGFSPGSLRPLAPQYLEGVVVISFLYPGGCDGGRCSDGTYDHRGPASVQAAADVLRFAMGLLTDTSGRTIDEVAGIPVLHDDVGLVALSNGGAMAMAVAATYGSQLPGLKWFVGWENPGNSQTVATDAGPGDNLFCPAPTPGARAVFTNPWYAYGRPSLDIDYTAVAYDPRMDVVFLDGNGNGRLDLRRRPDQCLDPDLDGDGSIGRGEDFGLGPAFKDAGPFRHYSRELTRALWDRGVFSVPPGWMETPEDSEAFWRLRDEVRSIPAAAAAVPDLETILVASYRDHVQTQPDHPHVRMVFEELMAEGMWVKLNPSPEIVTELAPALADLAFRPDPGIRVEHASNPMPTVTADGDTEHVILSATSGGDSLPDMPPGVAPEDWTSADWTYPESVPDDLMQAAAVIELARRAASKAAGRADPSSGIAARGSR